MSLCSGCIATHQHDQSSIIQQLAPPLDQRAVHLHHSYCSTHHHEVGHVYDIYYNVILEWEMCLLLDF